MISKLKGSDWFNLRALILLKPLTCEYVFLLIVGALLKVNQGFQRSGF